MNNLSRKLRWLAGETAWAELDADDALRGRVIWVGGSARTGCEAVAQRRARGLLGQCCDTLVFDARDGFDADAFGAVAGTLVGGGTLYLLTPRPTDWTHSRFLQRLFGLLDAPRPKVAASHAVAPVADADCLTPDQARAVEGLLRMATGHRHRPLVLTADRGRGKSAALGIAAARLLKDGRSVLLTAPSQATVAEVHGRAQALLPEASLHGSTLQYGEASLRYVAPDELLRHDHGTAPLLVDEAAAIPVPLLSRLLARHARIAFATTLHGYEGSGRGFALRFRAHLDAASPQWRGLTLSTPIRYAMDDPVEAWVNRALLLDAEPTTELPPGEPVIECIGQDALASDEALLRQVFGLLVQAHYQTAPNDLRQLLDAPDLSVWVARVDGLMAGVCLVLAEGGLDADLAEAVARGQRRPAGHLIPQSLAAHTGRALLARQRTARVMRIAVHDARRRQGLGRRMLDAVAQWAGDEGMDWWGASFGADPDSLAFWQAAGCEAVRLGAARDAASGTHSAVLLAPVSPAAQAAHEALRQRFIDTLRLGLVDSWRTLEAVVAWRLLYCPHAPVLMGQGDAEDVAAYAQGQRDVAAVRPALWRLCGDAAAQGVASEGVESLVGRILQARPDNELVAELGLAGRKMLDKELRLVAGMLLEKLS